MKEHQMTIKAKLLSDIRRTWDALNTTLQRLTDEQMTTLHDAEDWTVKDHIIHLTSWERSVAFFLQGKPRHEGLEVDEALYLNGSNDEINVAIFRHRRDLAVPDALAQFRDVHQQLLGLLQLLTDADLKRPYCHFYPMSRVKVTGHRPTM